VLYRSLPDAAQMAANGLTLEDFVDDYTAEVWPDTEVSINVFVAMSTQWRVGFSGRTGLDYGVLPQVMRMCGVERSDWPMVFEDIRVLELAALEQMSEN
jgi:collagenase-like PrtC family protease